MIGDCLCMRAGEPIDVLEVQKLVASVHVSGSLGARSHSEVEALFIAALSSALELEHEEPARVRVSVLNIGEADGRSEYKLTYEVIVPEGHLETVLQKARSIGLKGSHVSNRFADTLGVAQISIRDLATPVAFQGLTAARPAASTLQEDDALVAQDDAALPVSATNWLLLVGAALLCLALGCVGAGFWHGKQKAIPHDFPTASPPIAALSVTTIDLEDQDYFVVKDDAESPDVHKMRNTVPGFELLTDLNLPKPSKHEECPPCDEVADYIPQPNDALCVSLPGRNPLPTCARLPAPPEGPMPIPAAAWFTRDEVKRRLPEPVHWSVAPSPRAAPSEAMDTPRIPPHCDDASGLHSSQRQEDDAVIPPHCGDVVPLPPPSTGKPVLAIDRVVVTDSRCDPEVVGRILLQKHAVVSV